MNLWDTGKQNEKKKAADDLIQLDDVTNTMAGCDDLFGTLGAGKKVKSPGSAWGNDIDDDSWSLGTKTKAGESVV